MSITSLLSIVVLYCGCQKTRRRNHRYLYKTNTAIDHSTSELLALHQAPDANQMFDRSNCVYSCTNRWQRFILPLNQWCQTTRHYCKHVTFRILYPNTYQHIHWHNTTLNPIPYPSLSVGWISRIKGHQVNLFTLEITDSIGPGIIYPPQYCGTGTLLNLCCPSRSSWDYT